MKTTKPLQRRQGLSQGCGTRGFADEIAAKLALTGSDEKRAYFHEMCGEWHLTSLPQRPERKAPAAQAPARKPRKDTGPSGKTRALVLAREKSCCAACGKYIGAPGTWWSIQHRVARGVGGDSSLPNLVALCGSATSPGCHRVCEDRDEHMHERGFWLESWQDPTAEPVMLHSAHGSEMTVWLLIDGTYGLEVPGEAA